MYIYYFKNTGILRCMLNRRLQNVFFFHLQYLWFYELRFYSIWLCYFFSHSKFNGGEWKNVFVLLKAPKRTKQIPGTFEYYLSTKKQQTKLIFEGKRILGI